jgi:hypothetical protein
MSHDKITSLVNSVANALTGNEKLAVPLLAVKLQKIAELNSHDQTLIAIANVISKMEENNKLVISKAQFKDLYQKLYTKGTKFASYFKDELGEVNNLKTPKLASKQELPLDTSYEKFVDPILSNALNSAFDKSVPLKSYSQDIADKASKIVNANLDSWNLKASKLEVEAGNEAFIIVKADYDTPKGLTSILIPVEIVKEKVSHPSFFMGNSGPKDLNNVNIKEYITSNAGAKLRVKAQEVVNILTSATSQNKEVGEVELALTKVNASRETNGAFFADQVLGQALTAKAETEVVLPKLGEFKTFAEKFESPLGYANFKFGVQKVNLGREVIARILANLHVKNAQINVFNASDTSITYAVSIAGKTAFTVPVKVANNKIVNPDVIICNGSVLSFSQDTLSNLFAKNTTDYKAAAVASTSYNLNASSLIANVKEAMEEDNYAKAEDALNVLYNSDDQEAYRTAFNIYMNGLGMTKTASKTSCSMIVKSANSTHPVCGHTGLPLHKVYQDEHGDCHPHYRKGMSSPNSEAYFMNAKIFG